VQPRDVALGLPPLGDEEVQGGAATGGGILEGPGQEPQRAGRGRSGRPHRRVWRGGMEGQGLGRGSRRGWRMGRSRMEREGLSAGRYAECRASHHHLARLGIPACVDQQEL
jgi:hypothetical protein